MKFQRIASIGYLAVILTAVFLVYHTHAHGVYVVSWNYTTNDRAAAGNDVRLNISTPPGHYSGAGSCTVQVGLSALVLEGPLWVTVESSGWDGEYSVGQQSLSLDGSESPKSAYAHGYID